LVATVAPPRFTVITIAATSRRRRPALRLPANAGYVSESWQSMTT
jgi:hypothetical protein